MATVELPCGHTCAFVTDPLTGQKVEDPVLLPCGHTFGRIALEDWFSENGSSKCFIGCPLPAEFEAIPNKAISAAIEELWEQPGKRQVFLSRHSLLPFHPSLFGAYLSRQIHYLRTMLLVFLKPYSGVLFGSTPREYRRINQTGRAFEGMPKCDDRIIAPGTDIDVAFEDADSCQEFEASVAARFEVQKKRTHSYQLQGLQVRSYIVWFPFQKGSRICMSMDLVYPDPTVGLGCTWPDFIECQLACQLGPDQPEYVINPLIEPDSFFAMKGGRAIESRQGRFVRQLLRHMDDHQPWRWCLMRPAHLMRMVKTDRYLQSVAYELYVRSQLRRLAKFLCRGVSVQGISTHYSKETKQFVLPCGHQQLKLHQLECLYDDEMDCLVYICETERQQYPFFREFQK